MGTVVGMATVVDVLAFWERTGDDRAALPWEQQVEKARELVMLAQIPKAGAAAYLATVDADMEATPETD